MWLFNADDALVRTWITSPDRASTYPSFIVNTADNLDQMVMKYFIAKLGYIEGYNLIDYANVIARGVGANDWHTFLDLTADSISTLLTIPYDRTLGSGYYLLVNVTVLDF